VRKIVIDGRIVGARGTLVFGRVVLDGQSAGGRAIRMHAVDTDNAD
jgi:hypothetical protein